MPNPEKRWDSAFSTTPPLPPKDLSASTASEESSSSIGISITGTESRTHFTRANDVLYFSIHQSPLFPGTGSAGETGTGPGEGFTINVPLRPGKGDGDYLHVIRAVLAPVAAQFRPEFILVSAGYDIADGDPLGGMRVTPSGFGRLTKELMILAEASAQNRMVFFLEGGYDQNALGKGILETLRTLAGRSPHGIPDPGLSPGLRQELAPALAAARENMAAGRLMKSVPFRGQTS